jgi:hypothetical protein
MITLDEAEVLESRAASELKEAQELEKTLRDQVSRLDRVNLLSPLYRQRDDAIRRRCSAQRRWLKAHNQLSELAEISREYSSFEREN